MRQGRRGVGCRQVTDQTEESVGHLAVVVAPVEEGVSADVDVRVGIVAAARHDDQIADVVSGDVLEGYQFLLASDGLTRVVQDDELASQLLSAPPDQAAGGWHE